MDNSFRIVRAGIRNVGKINGKVFFAIGTPVYGKDEIDVNGALCFSVADVVQSSCCGASPNVAHRKDTRDFFVIPAEAGIQSRRIYTTPLDSGFRRNDDIQANFLSTDWSSVNTPLT